MSAQTAEALAVCEGTRLRPLRRNCPKPMLPAVTRPILEHVLGALVDARMQRIFLVVGYRRERVQEFSDPSCRGVTLGYIIQQKQLGSDYALLVVRETADSDFLIVYGDRVIQCSTVGKVASTFEGGSAEAALEVLERQEAHRYGALHVHDRDIAEIVEKPESDTCWLINVGVYAFSPSIFDNIDETPREAAELALKDTIRRLDSRDCVRAVETGGLWVNAIYPWDLLEVAEEVFALGRRPGGRPRPDNASAPRSWSGQTVNLLLGSSLD